MFTLSCRDVGVDCDHMCKAETEEELMEKAKQHAIQDNHFSEEELSRPLSSMKGSFNRLGKIFSL